MNPAKAFAEQFVRRSPMALLAFGLMLSLADFATLYGAAARENVLQIPMGIGLLNNFGLFSTVIGNAISLYVAKKYYDGICAMRTSKAVAGSSSAIEKELSRLTSMISLRGRYAWLLYGFITVGVVAWLSNVSGHILDNPEIRWGHKVFDSVNHPATFVASRLHNVYAWIMIMPFLAHVMICSSFQLRKIITIASREGALAYDLLNPDARGGFSFVDNANLLFNVVVALAYIQVTLHIETFEKMNPEHVTAYVILTVILITVNRLFLGDIYASLRFLRLEALNNLKLAVYKRDHMSFEILKYCYERRLSPLTVVNAVIKVAAIVIPGVIKLWPALQKMMAT